MTSTMTDIRTAVLTSPDLPTLPVVASKLLALTASEETPLTEVADLIVQDMALSAKVLRVANSSFYSFSRQITSINHAVSILGTNAVRSLVLSFSFFSMQGSNNSHFDYQRFWNRCLTEAAAAKVIAEQLPGTDREEAFIAGLLQNIGQLVFATALSEQHQKVLLDAGDEGKTLDEALEEAHLGITHSAVGYEVAKQWGLPELHLHAIRHHHDPKGFTGKDEQQARIVGIVALADHLAAIFHSQTPETAHRRFRKEAKDLLGLNVLATNTILRNIGAEINAAAEYFDLDIPPTKSVAEILEEANAHLCRLNLSYEEMNRELLLSKIQLEKLTAELSHKNSLLENLANIDHLTEVANHRSFQVALDRELQRAVGNDGTVSILLMDIDHFMRVNDTYGHLMGDLILKEFCRITKEVIRTYDLLARYAGEEFIVILPETGPENAATVAEKIRCHVEQHLFGEGEAGIRVTVSIGIASLCSGRDDVEKQTLIGWADEALYQAKGGGRNRSVSYQPGRK